MHRLWVGSDPSLILGGLGFFLAALALIIHLWAYSIVGWPRYKREQQKHDMKVFCVYCLISADFLSRQEGYKAKQIGG